MCDEQPDMHETAMRAVFYAAIEDLDAEDLINSAKAQIIGNGPARNHGDHSVISDACEELEALLEEVLEDED